MNVIRSLALYLSLFCLFACKASDNQKQSTAQPKPTDSQAANLKNLDTKPPVQSSQLSINSLSVSVHRIDSNQSALVSIDAPEDVAEYYQFEFCSQKTPDDCIKSWYHASNFIVPGLKPGTYKVKVQACTRKERAVADHCGENKETYYEQPENPDDALTTKILRLFSLLPEAQNISFEVYNALTLYKQQLKDAGHKAPEDDIEVAINNILELGPYQNSAYYLSEGFDIVRDSILEQQSGPSEGLLLTESEYERYHKPDPNEPSTFGKVMILAGFAAVAGGISQFPSYYQMSPQQEKDEYLKRKKNLNQKPDPNRLIELNTKIENYPTPADLKNRNLKLVKKGFAIIAAGIATLTIGFSTRANLTEDTNSLESIRNSLLSKLDIQEKKLLEIVRERKALIEDIPF